MQSSRETSMRNDPTLVPHHAALGGVVRLSGGSNRVAAVSSQVFLLDSSSMGKKGAAKSDFGLPPTTVCWRRLNEHNLIIIPPHPSPAKMERTCSRF